MATKTHVQLIDDLDGSDAEETVSFGIDGAEYEIDLSGQNADALRDAMAPWIDHGRRLSGKRVVALAGRPGKKAAKPKLTVADRRAIQAYAEENGMHAPADRGRIAADVLTAWEEAGSPM